MKTCKKTATGQENDYTNSSLLDYILFHKT